MKKNTTTVPIADNIKGSKNQSIGNNSILSIFVVCLYLYVHFIDDFGAADVMGPQWLFCGLVDYVVLFYIAIRADFYKEAIAAILKHRFTIIYSFFVLWALGSYCYAINGIESLVCLARLVSTYLVFINLSILFYKQDYKWIFTLVAFILTIVLIIDARFVFSKFTENVDNNLNLDVNILSLMGRHGNKNVMAATLMIKIPFCLFLILDKRILTKVVGFIGMLAGTTSLLILNTRSTYVAIILIFIIFTFFTLLYFKKEVDAFKKICINILFFIVPFLIAYFAADYKIKDALESQKYKGAYGQVNERLSTVFSGDNDARKNLWKSAIDYFKHHPILGAGYGNWKLASIPYEKARATDLFVPYHAHNDFLENAAELGLLGGLAYLGLFVTIFIYVLKSWQNPKFEQYRQYILIGFLAMCCYGIDALFNFPAERTAMQTIFAISAALLFAPYFIVNNLSFSINKFTSYISNTFLVLAFLIIVPSIYISKQVFDSLKIQRTVMGEVNANPSYSTDSANMMPSIPNLSTSTLPIKALKARYYIRDSNYKEAIKLLRESYNDNVYIHYNDFLLTSVYASLKNYDSTLYYAKQAFYNWPRASSYYKNLMFAIVRKKDTAELNKAFNIALKYSNTALTYDEYIKASFELKSKTPTQLNVLLDTATKRFPNDDFKNTRILINSNGFIAPTTNNAALQGMQSFQKGNYLEAATFYKQAILAEPANYSHYENVGICLYSAKKFNDCLSYFDKAITFPENKTGKAEFYKGISMIALGKKSQGCEFLNFSKTKGYSAADNIIKTNCN